MEAKDKLIKARVKLQEQNPFFSYLTMYLKFIEKENIDSCGVDITGNFYYNPNFIESLSNSEVKTVLCHEVMHIALLHLNRLGSKDKMIWNIATDITINNFLVNLNFDFTGKLQSGLKPHNNMIEISDIEIKDLDKKFAEEIYFILLKEKSNLTKMFKSFGLNKMGEGFDSHIFSKNLPQEQKDLEKEIKKRLSEAYTHAKARGNSPKGVERYIDGILQEKLNWKEILYKYIIKEIPYDYSYSYPSKKSYSTGIYMPRITKETINIAVAVDVSGSIGKEELTEFISEIIGIAKSFENVKINVMFVDTAVNNHYVIENGNIEFLLNAEINGDGGTDFTGVYDYLNENIQNTKLLIFFTDGYACFPKEEEIKTLWIINKSGCSDENIPFGEIVRFE
jgi:predicted metal-dependent peptidase